VGRLVVVTTHLKSAAQPRPSSEDESLGRSAARVLTGQKPEMDLHVNRSFRCCGQVDSGAVDVWLDDAAALHQYQMENPTGCDGLHQVRKSVAQASVKVLGV